LNELLPIAGGILIGALLVRLPPPARLPVALIGVVVVGVLATVVSGEFRISLGFLAIDIPGTALAAFCSYTLLRSRAPGKRRSEDVHAADNTSNAGSLEDGG